LTPSSGPQAGERAAHATATSGIDFRRFVGLLEDAGELTRVREEIDWDLEVGARSRAEAAGQNRAVLFERVRGYPGARILTNAMGSPAKIGIALGLPAGQSLRHVRRVVRARLARPIPPVTVPGSSFEGSTFDKQDVDLALLPVPRWAQEDGGRYLGTWHINVTRDPVSGVRNVGVYRMQLVDSSTALVNASGSSHLMAHVRRAEELGEPLPMAVAIGVAEPLVLAAGMAVSPEIDELSLAGVLAGAPVLIRPAHVDGLEVPVDAEIVIEGHIVCGTRATEGPFVDYAGVASSNPSALVFRASHVSTRTEPIFRGAAVGYAGAEDHVVYALLASAGCLDFRGSRWSHHLQTVALRAGWFRAFQALGRVHVRSRIRRRLGRAAPRRS
jgi:4-hydroxy-3-polyprenylbenzoate decarboxylase